MNNNINKELAEVQRQYAKMPGGTPVPAAESVDDVVQFSQGFSAAFGSHRHDKSMGDRIRSAIGNNLGVMSTVVNQFAGAATSAFPPCAPVFTAFNYVVMAAKTVKADYDTLENFFNDIGSQLGNITIIKDDIASTGIKQLADAVGSIYAAALTASAFAIKYMRKKRFVKGVQALISGNDKELAAAYADLGVASKKLHEVVSFATLDVAQRSRLESKEGFAHTKEGIAHIEQSLDVLAKGIENPLEKLKKRLGATFKALKADMQPRKLLKGTGQWLFEEDSYVEWEQEAVSCLWISGSQGCGKTYLAAGAVDHLQTTYKDYKGTAVASCFFSDDRDESASVARALIDSVLQIASTDNRYAKSVLADIDDGDPRDWQKASVDYIWEQFFVKYYTHSSESSSAKLWLIVDGLETADNTDHALSDLLKLFGSIKASGISIQVLLLGQPSSSQDVTDNIPESDLATVEISSDKNSGDIALFVESKMCERPFKTFHADTLATIRDKLSKRKNFAYVRFALQEIGQQTQDDDALDQLGQLPQEFGSLIQRQIARVGKDLRPQKAESLRFLFHWVAHTRRPLSVEEARAIILLKTTYRDFSVETEIQARCAGIIVLRKFGEELEFENISAELEEPLLSSNDDFMNEPEDVLSAESPENAAATSGARDSETISSAFAVETDSQADPVMASTAPSSEIAYITLNMEESIVDYFHAASRPTSGLITNSSDAKFDIVITVMDVLCVVDQGGLHKKQEPLEEYAVTFWIEHLQNLDIGTCSATQITQVIERLNNIFENPGRASLLFEAHSSELYSGFNATIDPNKPVSSLIVHWCLEAQKLALPQLLMDWISTTIRNPTGIPGNLAREHFRHWLKSSPTQSTSTASIFMILFESVAAMGWDAQSPTPNYATVARTEQEIKWIGSLFPEINKDSSAYRAIGVTFSNHGYYASAISQFDISLDLADKYSDKIYSRIQKAYAFQALQKYDLACEDIDQALNDEFGQIVENKTRELSTDITEDKIAGLDPDIVKTIGRRIASNVLATKKRLDDAGIAVHTDWLLKAYTIRANSLAAQSKPQAAVAAYKQAIFVAYSNQSEEATDLFRALLQQYHEIGDYQGLMQQVKNLPVDKRRSFVWETCTEYLTYEGGHLLLRAAKISKLKDDLLAWFRDLRMSFTNRTARQAWCSYLVALAQWRFFNDEDAAYNELNKIYDQFYGPEGLDLTGSSAHESRFAIPAMAVISTLLAEIVFSRIYSSPVKWVKNLLIHDLERVSTSVLMSQSDNETQLALQGSTLVARAYLDHGKPYQGINRLSPIFARSIEALTDQDGDNDSGSFRLLARVLAFASVIEPSMRKQAQIAYSLQFSTVDARFKVPAKGQTATSGNDGLPVIHDEDLNQESEAGCDGCDDPETMCKWDRRSYMCLVCANVDLCSECYDKRIRANKANEVFFGFKNYCGFNHDYLEGPIPGWGGVKDGIISLGSERVKFEHWLKDVESKWEETKLRMPPRRKTMHF